MYMYLQVYIYVLYCGFFIKYLYIKHEKIMYMYISCIKSKKYINTKQSTYIKRIHIILP